MGRPSNTAQRKTQIAAGLLKVMARRGYDGASIEEIAGAAKLASGLIHYHFKTKRDILVFAMEMMVQGHIAALTQALEVHAHWNEKLAVFIDYHVGLGEHANPEHVATWVWFSGEALRDDSVAHVFQTSARRLCDVLARVLVGRSGLSSSQVRSASAAIVAAIHGYWVMGDACGKLVPRGSARSSLLKMCEGLLGCRLPAKSTASKRVAAKQRHT